MSNVNIVATASTNLYSTTTQSVEPACWGCLVSRIQVIWQAFCSWLTDWANWLFSTPSTVQLELKEKALEVIEIKPKEEAVSKAIATPTSQIRFSDDPMNDETLDDAGPNVTLPDAIWNALRGFNDAKRWLTIAKTLIKRGANLEEASKQSDTPLRIVLNTSRRHALETKAELIDVLLRHGASLSGKTFHPERTLRWLTDNPLTRLEEPRTHAVLSAFETERLSAIEGCTSFASSLQNIIIDYLDGIDYWPLPVKLDAHLHNFHPLFSPSIRKIILAYTFDLENITLAEADAELDFRWDSDEEDWDASDIDTRAFHSGCRYGIGDPIPELVAHWLGLDNKSDPNSEG